jgi:hypothetical protein
MDEEAKPHYICTECGYESHLAGTCQNEDCTLQGSKLRICRCGDSSHNGIVNATRIAAEEQASGPDSQDTDSEAPTKMVDIDSEETI